MALTIRIADASDAALLAALHCQTWRETYAGLLPEAILAGLSEARLYRMWRADLYSLSRDRDRAVFIADDGEGTPYGFAIVGKARSRALGADAEIEMIYVLRDHQDQGVGRALMAACARHGLARGLFSLGLWVVRANGPARRFYEKLDGEAVTQSSDRMGGFLIPVAGYLWEKPEMLAGFAPAPHWP